MYLTDRPVRSNTPDLTPTPDPESPEPLNGGGGRRLRVPGNVVALGLVSAFTDVGSEMVTSVAPAYLALTLSGSVSLIGAIDAAQQGMSAAVRVLAGGWSDRIRRYKPTAMLGYLISALCRVLTIPFGGTATGFGGLLAADRVGKGIRTSPRDAMIAMSAEPGREATAFGVHRALDTAGAVAGPLLAAFVLTVGARSYDTVWAVSAAFSVLALMLLWLWVTDPTQTPGEGVAPVISPAGVKIRDLFRDRRLHRLSVAAVVLGALSISDGILFLAVSHGTAASAAWFPLLAAGVAVTYLICAVPAGLIADRFGRRKVIAAGFGALSVAYLVCAHGTPGVGRAVVMVALLGVYYATTDGVLSAVAAVTAPNIPATAIGTITAVMLIGRLTGSLAVTRMWEHNDAPTVPLNLWAAAAAVVALIAYTWRTRQ